MSRRSRARQISDARIFMGMETKSCENCRWGRFLWPYCVEPKHVKTGDVTCITLQRWEPILPGPDATEADEEG